jgi:hypothetical protein
MADLWRTDLAFSVHHERSRIARRSLLAYLMFARVLSWLAMLARSDSAKPAWSPPPGAAVETELTHRGRRVL